MDQRYADRSLRGIGVLRERLESLTALYAFGSLSRCFSVLCADRFCVARCTSNKSVVFGAAALVKRNMNVFSDVVLALYWLSSLWNSNRFLRARESNQLRTGSSNGSELAPGSCWWKGG